MPKKTTNTVLYQETQIDNTTGEVTAQYTMQRVQVEPDYVKLYLDTVLTFNSLPITLNPILNELLKRMTYADDEQTIAINKAIKEKIAAKCGITTKRVQQVISQLTKKGVFVQIARGYYRVNPYVFGRGSWRDIQNIRATFDFAKHTINADIIQEQEDDDEPGVSS